MNREEFLQILQQGLADVAPEERVAARQYYTEYLDDAGPEHEAEVLEELGDPRQIIRDIQAESVKDGWTPPERTLEAIPVPPVHEATEKPRPENGAAGQTVAETRPKHNPERAAATPPNDGIGYPPPPPPDSADAHTQQGGESWPEFGTPNNMPPKGGYPPPGGAYYTQPQGAPSSATAVQPEAKSGGNTALRVLAIIFLWPFIIIFLIILFSLFFALVAILAVPVIVGVCLVVSCLPCFMLGGMLTAFIGPAGLVALGAGFFVLGLGLLCTWGGGVLLGKTVPAIFRGLVNFTKKVFSLA